MLWPRVCQSRPKILIRSCYPWRLQQLPQQQQQQKPRLQQQQQAQPWLVFYPCVTLVKNREKIKCEILRCYFLILNRIILRISFRIFDRSTKKKSVFKRQMKVLRYVLLRVGVTHWCFLLFFCCSFFRSSFFFLIQGLQLESKNGNNFRQRQKNYSVVRKAVSHTFGFRTSSSWRR